MNLTSAFKFFNSTHRIFIKARGNKVFGFIKVGLKKTMIKDERGYFMEFCPIHVNDFYVHESVQHLNHGRVNITILIYLINFYIEFI